MSSNSLIRNNWLPLVLSAYLTIFKLPLRSGCNRDEGVSVLWVFVVSLTEFLNEDGRLSAIYEHLWSSFVDVVAKKVIKVGVFDSLIGLEHLLAGRLVILGVLGWQSLWVYWFIQAFVESMDFFAIQNHHFAILRRHSDLEVIKLLWDPFLHLYLHLTVKSSLVEVTLLIHPLILRLRRAERILLKIEGKQARLILILNPLIIWIHLVDVIINI